MGKIQFNPMQRSARNQWAFLASGFQPEIPFQAREPEFLAAIGFSPHHGEAGMVQMEQDLLRTFQARDAADQRPAGKGFQDGEFRF